MSDYERIEAIIRYLDDKHASQPAIPELAAIAGLSSSHFHRLFKRWAGISPKDFLQCLTLEHARRCLESSSVLDAALDAGLSGPGRLHDLCVSIEAASPGEVKSGGAGIRVEWGAAESPFGLCSLGWNNRGICHLAFHEQAPDFPVDLIGSWPAADFVRKDKEAARRIGGIFSATDAARFPAFVSGSIFQLKVWRALIKVPEGSLATYSRIACLIGRPGAARAVGAACGSNPVAWLIPCHRVILETGIVKGYHWGAERKKAMLAWEGARALQQKSGAPVYRAPLL